MTFGPKHEHVSAVAGAPDGSSEGTPTLRVHLRLQWNCTCQQ